MHSTLYSTFQYTEGKLKSLKVSVTYPLPLKPNIVKALLLLDDEGVVPPVRVPPLPPDAFVKVEVVVILKEEEEGLDLDDWFCAGCHGREGGAWRCPVSRVAGDQYLASLFLTDFTRQLVRR
eukprot:scaffold69932_cov43-Phaeocystis_antarctica.AAC.2